MSRLKFKKDFFEIKKVLNVFKPKFSFHIFLLGVSLATVALVGNIHAAVDIYNPFKEILTTVYSPCILNRYN